METYLISKFFSRIKYLLCGFFFNFGHFQLNVNKAKNPRLFKIKGIKDEL